MSRAKRPHKQKSHKKKVTPKYPKVQPQSLLACFNYFLTPQGWKQVLRHWNPKNALRWRPQPLLLVVILMTWCAGDSQAERFETAKAFYVASYQRQRRPGRSPGWLSERLGPGARMRPLRAVATAVRARLQAVFAQRWLVDGFVPLGCDGSRLNCPRSPELEQRLRTAHPRKLPIHQRRPTASPPRNRPCRRTPRRTIRRRCGSPPSCICPWGCCGRGGWAVPTPVNKSTWFTCWPPCPVWR